MKRTLAAFFFLIAASTASGAQNITVVFGTSTFSALSFDFTVGGGTAGGGAASIGGGARTSVGGFRLTKAVDNSSPGLFQDEILGTVTPKVTITVAAAGASGATQPVLVYTFTDVVVTSVQWTGPSGESAPEETITFQYQSLSVEYAAQNTTVSCIVLLDRCAVSALPAPSAADGR